MAKLKRAWHWYRHPKDYNYDRVEWLGMVLLMRGYFSVVAAFVLSIIVCRVVGAVSPESFTIMFRSVSIFTVVLAFAYVIYTAIKDSQIIAE